MDGKKIEGQGQETIKVFFKLYLSDKNSSHNKCSGGHGHREVMDRNVGDGKAARTMKIKYTSSNAC